jgi:hypothetical protein
VTIKSHQTYINLTDEFFKQRLLSIFEQCCEKGTREETWAAALLVDRHSGRSTIETIHEVRLKQSCATFDNWVEQASQPARSSDEPPEPTTPAALFFSPYQRHARRASPPLAVAEAPRSAC